ncbi:hypothetical protein KR084_006106 [Drosophila pseudotakahashii]|nr:hypothetical protein KR084_006106 [Drosophila pseudotakahashii]
MANGSTTEAAATGTPQQRIPQTAQQALLTEGGVNDLVADVCLNGRATDYSSMRASTSTGGAGSGAASSSSSSFSFKHFLSSTGTVTAPTSTVTSAAVQTSTGARPKVPQSASASHMQPPDVNGSSASSRMKRSPRFSSFDSQASLAEYAACGGGPSSSSGASQSQHRLRPDLRLGHDVVQDALDNDDDDHVALAQVRNTSRLYDERIDDDIFPSAASNQQPAIGTRYVPRSYSNYDMPPQLPCPSSSPRRRPSGNRDQRPTRLVLSAGPKMKLDLPLDTCNAVGGGGAAAASALPDFVQDHLADTWCGCQDALSSPPNSPIGAAEASSGAVGLLPSALAPRGLPSAAPVPGPPGEPAAGSTVKMLPDFLSDGPIIHSSQRLADVAIGLPSNSIDSPPQEAIGTLQLSTLRQENERLQRELQEARAELNVQTRRASDFEQQLLQFSEAARRREALATTTNTQTTQHLRRQLAQLAAELSSLRGSGGSDCAAGGVPVAGLGRGSESSASSGISNPRPSRTHHLSRDLLRAADTAEQNLRQLLTGVENLRQMAANLEQPAPTTTPRSPDLYTDFN